MRVATVLALVLATVGGSAAAGEYTTDGAVLEPFQCPEALADDSARLAALQQFLTWMRDHHPDWSVAKAAGFRVYLLERHHCEESLAALRGHTRTRP